MAEPAQRLEVVSYFMAREHDGVLPSLLQPAFLFLAECQLDFKITR